MLEETLLWTVLLQSRPMATNELGIVPPNAPDIMTITKPMFTSRFITNNSDGDGDVHYITLFGTLKAFKVL